AISNDGSIFDFNNGTRTIVVTNSTITGNEADSDDNGVGTGGGISNSDPGETVILVNTTVLENNGDGVDNNGNLTLSNSIIALSEGADFSGNQPTIFGTNIVADNTLSPALPGIEAVNPATLLFSELQDNGGPTQTFLPLEGNPVIDFGENAALSEAVLGVDLDGDGDTEDSLLTDQRVFNRIFNDTVDIGAVEAGASEFVAAPNSAPTFTSPAAASILEGTTEVVTLTAADAEGDELSFSITGGADQDAFTIADPLTGALTFLAAPDFETPGDADGDNVFEVEVSVTDGINDPVVQALTVTVTDDPADNPDDAPNTPTPVNLDVDGSGGDIVPAVDILNIFRVLAGAPQAVVVPDGVEQQAVVNAVEAFDDLALDVDGSGEVVAAVDILNIFRVLAGAPQAVVVPDGVEQQAVVDAVDALIE
ncbi:MAG: cadherin repeat domain-containing protein, partial [Cyanobacteria bacterium J06641_5]